MVLGRKRANRQTDLLTVAAKTEKTGTTGKNTDKYENTEISSETPTNVWP